MADKINSGKKCLENNLTDLALEYSSFKSLNDFYNLTNFITFHFLVLLFVSFF